MPDIDENSDLKDEENMYSNDPEPGELDPETGKIKNGKHHDNDESGGTEKA